jgi:hemerythrin-like domain-containing protein
LIHRLSSEHSEIEQAFAGLRPHQFRTDEGRDRLTRVRDLLRAHAAGEEQELYPVLRRAAAQDGRIAGQLGRLTDDLRIVTGLTDEFFRRYEIGVPQLVEFTTDHAALLAVLRSRLKREEQTIFPLYETLSRN